MKTSAFSLFFLLLGSILLSACAASPAINNAAPPTATPSTSAGGDQVVIRIAAGSVGQEYETTLAGAQRYMKSHPNVRIEVIDAPELSDDRLGYIQSYLERHSSEIDIYQIDVIWPGTLARHFVDLYKYGAGRYTAEHFPAIIANNTVNGRLVAMPWFVDAGLLYYRTDLFAKYEYDHPPATWDELEEMAQRIQEGERAENPNFWGYVWQGHAYEGLTCNALEWIASNGGGTIITPSGLITINNVPAIQAVQRAAHWVGTISPPGVLGLTEEDARTMFQNGNAAFMRNWPYAYNLLNALDSDVRAQVGIAPLPAGDSGQSAATLGGWQLAVSRYSNHPEIAADVVFYLTGQDEQKIRAINAGYNPTIPSLYQDKDVLLAAPYFRDLYDVFTNAVARPSTVAAPLYSETSSIFYFTVHDILNGKVDAPSAFRTMNTQLESLLGFSSTTR
ncbi:MAG: extracellular solute-binding protein [Anaerolineae bacterium]|nr:MAG: extracellular solute-binding protein [Anaerolineae bacterium]